MTNRVLALLLALAMILSILPLGVWATEEAGTVSNESSIFTLRLAPQGHSAAEGSTQLGLYLSATRAAQVGSFQFTLNDADNLSLSEYTGTGMLGENNIVAFVAQNAASTVSVSTGSVLLGTLTVSGSYIPGTSITLSDVEVNEWNTGTTEPGTASVAYGESVHDEDAAWTQWTSSKLPSESGHYYLTGDISSSFTALDAADKEIDITLCLNGHNVTLGGRGYSLSNGVNLTICDCTAHTDANGNLVAGTITPGNANGGVIYNTSSSLSLENVIIDGKGIVNNGDAAAIYANGTSPSVTLDNVVIRNCTANKYGAIFITGGNLSITNSVIENCAGTAGAVYMHGKAQAELTNVTMTGNTTSEAGGSAVAVFGESVCTINGGRYTGNISTKASGASGAIYVGNAPTSLVLKGAVVVDSNTCTASDGTLVERNVTIQGNADDITLNAIVTVDGLTDGADLDIYSTTTYTDASFLTATENQTGWDSAWIGYKGYQVIRQNGQFILSHGHADDEDGIIWTEWTQSKLPTTSGHYYLTSDLNVGWIEIKAADGETEANVDIVICLNGYDVSIGGRAYSLYNGAKVTFCDCTAHKDKNGDLVAGVITPGNASGGIVYNSGASLTVKDVVVDGTGVANANNGGAFFMNGNATTTLENVVIRNCTALNGSAISATRGTLNMTDCVLENNTTTGDAGGVIHLNGADSSTNVVTANLTRCTITDNTAAKAGSAMYAIRAAVNLNESVITDNITQNTSNFTGGVYICGTNPTVTISGKTIIDDNYVGKASRECNVFLQNNSDIALPKLYFKDLSTSAKLGLTTYTDLTTLETSRWSPPALWLPAS